MKRSDVFRVMTLQLCLAVTLGLVLACAPRITYPAEAVAIPVTLESGQMKGVVQKETAWFKFRNAAQFGSDCMQEPMPDDAAPLARISTRTAST